MLFSTERNRQMDMIVEEDIRAVLRVCWHDTNSLDMAYGEYLSVVEPTGDSRPPAHQPGPESKFPKCSFPKKNVV